MPKIEIQNYLNDDTVDQVKRSNIMDGLNSGNITEDDVLSSLKSTYGNKYGDQGITYNTSIEEANGTQPNFGEISKTGATIEEAVPEKKPGFFKRVIASTKEKFGKAQDVGEEARIKRESGEPIEGVAKQFQAGLKAVAAPISALGEEIAKPITSGFGTLLETGLKKNLGEEEGAVAFERLKVDFGTQMQEAQEKFDALPSEAQTALGIVGAGAEVAGALEGAGAIKSLGTSVAKKVPGAAKVVGEGAAAIAKSFDDSVVNIRNTVTQLAPKPNPQKSAALVESMNKILPTKTQEFQRLAKGQTHGEWLVDRGIIGTPEESVVELFSRFKQAKNALDDSVSKVPGSFNGPEVENVLTELKDFFAPAKGKPLTKTQKGNVDKIDALIEKHAVDGLSGSEVLDVKRILEREVKLDFMRENVPGNVRRANELDSELREFLTLKLEERGFPEFRDLSKEIQLSRFLADEIGTKLIRKTVNNEFGLVDNMDMLGLALSPKALGAIVGKKFLTSDFFKKMRAQSAAPDASKADLPIPKAGQIEGAQQKLPVGTEASPIELGPKKEVIPDEPQAPLPKK